MTELNENDFPPLEPQPFLTEKGREIERLRAELAAEKARAGDLSDEVKILRIYGNKDCTSMADSAIAAMRKGEANA